jgi:peptidoglycan/xylan/chitin deacetylase (PgdA/CDA1 family)
MTDHFPVCIGIDVDGEAPVLGRSPENANRPVLLSAGAFEFREGLPLLLAVLDEFKIRASFYVPGLVAEKYPEAIGNLKSRGHEVGSHGYAHRSPPLLTPEEEKSELVRGIDAVEAAIGERPTLWRSPAWDWSERTLQLLLDEGVDVSANFHDSLRPYRHLKNGKPVPLVEIPVQWHLADNPFFFHGGQPGRVIRTAQDAQTVWQDEFDGLYDIPGTFYHLTLHVNLIAHPGRLRMLERHLKYLKSHDRVRFMTASELADTVA